MENPDLVLYQAGDSQSPTHSRPAKCHSRQAIQARLDHPDKTVPPFRGLSVNMLPVAPASSTPVCSETQPVYVQSIYVPSILVWDWRYVQWNFVVQTREEGLDARLHSYGTLSTGIRSILNVYFSWTLAGCLQPPEKAFSSTNYI